MSVAYKPMLPSRPPGLWENGWFWNGRPSEKSPWSLVLIALLSVSLSGCGMFTAKTQWETLVFVPNERLRQRLNAAAPPDPDLFMAADDQERLILLSEAFIRQTQVVGQCNIQMEGLDRWVDEIVKAYPEADVRYRKPDPD